MASTPEIEKLLSHITACRNAFLPGGRLAFHIGDRHVGYVSPELAAKLAANPDIKVTDRVVLHSAAAGQLNAIAKAAGIALRDENFDVRQDVDGPVLAILDRGAVPDFGVIGAGVHVNGLVKNAAGWHLWVGKRAADKKLDPGKLDHLVAGGIAAGFSRQQTLLKEAAEEASLPPSLAAKARPVAFFRYDMQRPEGLRRDAIFAYDLILPESFTPIPADGEMASFTLMPLDEVFKIVATTDDFKFNVNLVLIDLFIRFGMIAGADEGKVKQALLF